MWVDLSLGFLFCSLDLYFCLCPAGGSPDGSANSEAAGPEGGAGGGADARRRGGVGCNVFRPK